MSHTPYPKTMDSKTKYVVIKSPWPDRLPVGTKIKETRPRPSSHKFKGAKWFVRDDGQLLFDEETDGKFRLFYDEFDKLES